MTHDMRLDAQILIAAQTGDVAGVKAAVQQGADPNAGVGAVLAHIARQGDLEAVQWLVEAGARVEEGGGVALVTAVDHNQTEIALWLLEASKQVTGGRTALVSAVVVGNLALIHALLARGVDPDGEGAKPLALAAGTGALEAMQLLLDAGASVDGITYSPIEWATDNGQSASLHKLLQAGADPNGIKGKMGFPLCGGIMFNHLDTVDMLLQAGADVGRIKAFGVEIRHLTKKLQHDHIAVLKRLAQSGLRPMEFWYWSRPPDTVPEMISLAKGTKIEAKKTLLIAELLTIGAETCLAMAKPADLLFLVREGLVSATQALGAARTPAQRRQLAGVL